MAGLGDLLGTVGVASQYPKTVPGESMLGVLEGAVRDVLPVGPLTDKYFGLKADPQYLDKMMNIGLAGLTVWHGSPHKFNRFDMSKIGTGEGAQAYGHGLYLAENPGVAKDYANKLSQGNAALGNVPLDGLSKEARKIVEYNLFNNDMYRVQRFAEQGQPAYKEAWEFLSKNARPQANLYRVDLPDEHIAKMLDWDKPLSQMSPEVQKALAPFVPKGGVPIKDGMGLAGGGKLRIRESITGTTQYFLENGGKEFRLSADDVINLAGSGQEGKSIYQMLRTRLGSDEKASAKLRELGIPGIKYLDQGSRGAGQGTRNFVVFDDQLPKIIGRE